MLPARGVPGLLHSRARAPASRDSTICRRCSRWVMHLLLRGSWPNEIATALASPRTTNDACASRMESCVAIVDPNHPTGLCPRPPYGRDFPLFNASHIEDPETNMVETAPI